MADRLIELGEVLPLLNEDIQAEIMERLDTELRDIVEQFQADSIRQSPEGRGANLIEEQNTSGLTSALYRQLSDFSKVFSELPSIQDSFYNIYNSVLANPPQQCEALCGNNFYAYMIGASCWHV